MKENFGTGIDETMKALFLMDPGDPGQEEEETMADSGAADEAVDVLEDAAVDATAAARETQAVAQPRLDAGAVSLAGRPDAAPVPGPRPGGEPELGAGFVPAVPQTLADTGLSPGFVADLLLRSFYTRGALTGEQLADFVCLPFTVLDENLFSLQQRRLLEVHGSSGAGRGGYRFDLTGAGRERAQEALLSTSYAGPAPVPLLQYREALLTQTIRDVRLTGPEVEKGMQHLVIAPELLNQLGPAINSAKSVFLYGDSGNGKTRVAEAIARLLGGAIYIPHAVLVDGQVIVLYDPVHHRPADSAEMEEDAETPAAPALWRDPTAEYDRRFVRVQRPVAVAGGELTLDQLDLRYDPASRLYQAPFQMKANGGILLIDDFGRQRIPPRELLNRWIVPLEKRRDYLTLHTGGKFPIPFDCLLIFSTNLDPSELVEEAFMRRIHYKIRIPDPTRPEYEEIFRRCCEVRRVPFTRTAVDQVYGEFYGRRGLAPRACHPRDILEHVIDLAHYLDVEPVLSKPLLRAACRSYFLSPGTASAPAAPLPAEPEPA